ncbi:hypothetical protein BHE74_00021263 [Ensete ventricosum]|nr:hypothetical protein BHE74_00021263 [Ensete ventricosum]
MALIDHVHDAYQVISCMGDKITNLRNEIRELKVGLGLEAISMVEQQAADLQSEVNQLKADLEEATSYPRIWRWLRPRCWRPRKHCTSVCRKQRLERLKRFEKRSRR